MATLSTLGQMMLNLDPGIRPYSEAELTANRIQGGRVNTQTALLQLEDLRRAQETQAAARAYYQQHPEELLGQQGQPMPILGSLGPQGGPPGAITQQPFGAGGASQAQTIPASPDASRYAAVSPQGGGPLPAGVGMPTVTPPQSTIASLTPQPQAQPSPQDRLMALARTNPEAAALIQQRMQQQQDRQSKLEEQRLDIGVKVSEAVARQLQGVTDQASLDAARERVRLIHPQAAAQIPQVYSKEAVESLQQRGIAVADMAKWRKDMASARQTEVTTEQLPKVFGALEQFATGGPGGTTQAPAETTTTAVPPTSRQTAAAPADFEPAIAEANRLFPQVSKERITSIIAAESNFDRTAESKAGAQGPMQLMPGTAKDMGVTDPFDLTQNVRGGTRYYAQLLTKYGGDERKALTAYNWGPKNLDDAGGDVSKAPPETQAYVQKVLGGGGARGSSTAAAPKADPRIAQLQARIDQGNKAALQAEAVGMEGPARQVRAQVEQLIKERDRLQDQATTERHRAEEIPRAAETVRAQEQARYGEKQRQQGGPMLPEARRDLFTKLRTDIRAEPTFKTYQEVRNGYQNVRIGAEANSAQGDLALINGMAKILDPGSTVMSGEARNVETAQGELERWFGYPQKFFEGDRLTPENRQKFLALAQTLARQKLSTAETELRQVYEPFAKEGGFQFSQLLPLEKIEPVGAGPNVSKFEKLVAP